ncbi:MAG TPA: hypothetical protein VEY92_05340, partial [Pseudoxanthomonas sp.]|nr:hypothetical protein [Pseudoxanthomonas sp.]
NLITIGTYGLARLRQINSENNDVEICLLAHPNWVFVLNEKLQAMIVSVVAELERYVPRTPQRKIPNAHEPDGLLAKDFFFPKTLRSEASRGSQRACRTGQCLVP